MGEMVLVSLLGKQSYRPGKGQPTINYKRGIVSMPIEQARVMGLEHRIVKAVPFGVDEMPVQRVPFGGRFDEKLTNTLTAAGYTTLAELTQLSHDQIMAIPGVGPAAYEKIVSVHGEE